MSTDITHPFTRGQRIQTNNDVLNSKGLVRVKAGTKGTVLASAVFGQDWYITLQFDGKYYLTHLSNSYKGQAFPDYIIPE